MFIDLHFHVANEVLKLYCLWPSLILNPQFLWEKKPCIHSLLLMGFWTRCGVR